MKSNRESGARRAGVGGGGSRRRAARRSGRTSVAHALGERVKELNCLYAIARLAGEHAESVDALLEGAARALPPAWQYPEVACTSIVYRGRTFACGRMSRARAAQRAAIRVDGEAVGEVAAGYTARRPGSDEGPFLREERALLDAVAEVLGVMAARIEAAARAAETARALTAEREALREANAALRGVLARIEEEKREIRADIRAQIERVLLPILAAMEIELPAGKRPYVDLLRRSLAEVAAPFAGPLASASSRLTPVETAICAMIRGGLRTKDIARLRGISPATVNRHRENIRRKLGLTGRGVNLTSHLLSEPASA